MYDLECRMKSVLLFLEVKPRGFIFFGLTSLFIELNHKRKKQEFYKTSFNRTIMIQSESKNVDGKDKGTNDSNTARIADKRKSDKKRPTDKKYNLRSKEDLRQKAKHVGIKGYKRMSKDELVKALEEA